MAYLGARAMICDSPDVGPDLELMVRRAAGGDCAAFEALYRRHAGLVYATCLRISGRRALAEELSQETFVRAWRGLPSLHDAAGFTAWVARIAANVSLDSLRSAGRAAAREAAPDEARGIAVDPDCLPAAAQIDMERAIAGLPAKARAVFVLFEIQGWTHEEIAHALGVTDGTSKAQLHRARRLLREELRR
jgi:RNA polymerase sigma-70 factor (ECF subfamily)